MLNDFRQASMQIPAQEPNNDLGEELPMTLTNSQEKVSNGEMTPPKKPIPMTLT
jgi:hypothetical protein